MLTETVETRTQTIARLNDELRAGRSNTGRFVVTSAALAAVTDLLIGDNPSETRAAAARQLAPLHLHRAVAEAQIDADNDPHSEHDFGTAAVRDVKLFWKIDYYDKSLEFGSEDPADPAQTIRVLTIMLPADY